MIYDQGERRSAADVVPISIDANRDYSSLLRSGNTWSNLVAPGAASKAVRTNVCELVKRLTATTTDSLLGTIQSQRIGVDCHHALKQDSIARLYEAQLLLSCVVEESNEAPLRPLPARTSVSTKFGSIRIQSRQLLPGDGSREMVVRVDDAAALGTLLDRVRARDQALQAGMNFAKRAKEVAKQPSIDDRSRDPIPLGSYVFRGPDAALAVDAFLSRNLPDLHGRDASIRPHDVQSIARARPSRTVTEIVPHESYEIRGDWIWYRIDSVPGGEIELSAQLIPSQLIRSTSAWYSRSQAAAELHSIFLATGIATAIPLAIEKSTELVQTDQFGEGYSLMSRAICSTIFGSKVEFRAALHDLDGAYEHTLAATLQHFSAMCRYESTRLVIDLLISALRATPLAPETPSFSLPDQPSVPSVCVDAEWLFACAVKSGAYALDHFFLHKYLGEETSLTRVPIAVDGVVIPRGTLCLVNRIGDHIDWVRPIRLSAYSLPLDHEIDDAFASHIRGAHQKELDLRAVYDALDGRTPPPKKRMSLTELVSNIFQRD